MPRGDPSEDDKGASTIRLPKTMVAQEKIRHIEIKAAKVKAEAKPKRKIELSTPS